MKRIDLIKNALQNDPKTSFDASHSQVGFHANLGRQLAIATSIRSFITDRDSDQDYCDSVSMFRAAIETLESLLFCEIQKDTRYRKDKEAMLEAERKATPTYEAFAPTLTPNPVMRRKLARQGVANDKWKRHVSGLALKTDVSRLEQLVRVMSENNLLETGSEVEQ